MLKIIALESKNLTEYARRAEAFNATEASPVSDHDLVITYLTFGHAPGDIRKHHATVLSAIRKARRERVSKREALWGHLIAGVEQGVES